MDAALMLAKGFLAQIIRFMKGITLSWFGNVSLFDFTFGFMGIYLLFFFLKVFFDVNGQGSFATKFEKIYDSRSARVNNKPN